LETRHRLSSTFAAATEAVVAAGEYPVPIFESMTAVGLIVLGVAPPRWGFVGIEQQQIRPECV
jgi:hypothetical protein